MAMRCFVLCKRYYTNKDLLTERFGRLYHLPVGFAHAGWTVEVAALDYRHHRSSAVVEEGVTFRALPAAPLALPLLPLRLTAALKRFAPDVIIASGDSHIGFIALQLARKMGVPFVFDVYDYYPAFAGNRLPGMKWMFSRGVERADLVLTASAAMCERMRLLNPSVCHIANGVDPSLFRPMDQATCREALAIDGGEPLIGYFGSITTARMPLLLEAMRRLRSDYPGIRLLLAGKADIPLEEPWIIYCGQVAQRQLPAMINACDVVAVPYPRDAFNDMAGACKIAEYLACGKPVVATRVSDHETIFANAAASLCEPDAGSLEAALRRQLEEPEIVPFPPHFAWQEIQRKLIEETRRLLSRSGIR